MQRIYSVFIWTGILLLILFWLPLLFVSVMFEKEPGRYRTGRLFRKLGLAMSRINPNWKVELEGYEKIDDRQPYIMVSNHLSNADIPVISNLPWEMKWIAKKELFNLPVVGWMMKMAGDISVERKSGNQIAVFKKCRFYLKENISLMFFPEGTRSKSGKLNRFAQGAFDLAIREQIPVLPMVLDGTQDCLPKKTWVFKPGVRVKLKVLDPVDPSGFSKGQAAEMSALVRRRMASQLAEWRGTVPSAVDALAGRKDGGALS